MARTDAGSLLDTIVANAAPAPQEPPLMFELEMATPAARRTKMYAEAGDAGARVDAQYKANRDRYAELGARLRKLAPRFVITCARGSSDHAAVYAKYLIETRARRAVSSTGPSISSLYKTALDASGALCIAISQSGKSPDLLASVEAMKRAGALVIAFVNAEGSPLESLADETVPLCAGPEKSVAATKSYLASLAGVARLTAEWTQDKTLSLALDALPAQLEAAWGLDWSEAALALEKAQSCFVLGRGIGYGAAREAALKLKETCSLHAEAYSAAEVLHGPAALVRAGFPVIALSQADATRASMQDALETLSGYGARVFSAGANGSGMTALPTVAADPAVEPMLMVQSFYRMANMLSVLRGYDPDHPPHLSKVTETV